MTKFLAVVGAIVLLFWALGAVGIGQFNFYYGPEQHDCTTEKP